MKCIQQILGAAAVTAALSILPISGAALADEGGATAQPAEFAAHMDEFAGEIRRMIASVDAMVADYKPGTKYEKQIMALTEQWESLEFHETLEDSNAKMLYPPIWAALGEFFEEISAGKPVEAVRAKGDAIGAALWQGYGALQYLVANTEAGADGGQDAAATQPQGSAEVLGVIDDNLDQVLVLYQDGKSEQAQKLIYDTYMDYFEGIEGELIEQDAKLVSGLEADFNATLPNLIKKKAGADKVAAQIDAMKKDLDRAKDLLKAAEKSASKVF